MVKYLLFGSRLIGQLIMSIGASLIGAAISTRTYPSKSIFRRKGKLKALLFIYAVREILSQ